jgi:hypothetical protein
VKEAGRGEKKRENRKKESFIKYKTFATLAAAVLVKSIKFH